MTASGDRGLAPVRHMFASRACSAAPKERRGDNPTKSPEAARQPHIESARTAVGASMKCPQTAAEADSRRFASRTHREDRSLTWR